MATIVLAGCNTQLWPQDGDPTGSAGQPLPATSKVEALSGHYILITLVEAAPTGTVPDPADYVIVAPDSSKLAVHTARLSDDRWQVILTTDMQEDVEYELSFAAGTTADQAMRFGGTTDPEPGLLSATSHDETGVLLTFSEPLEATAAQDPTSYEIRHDDEGEDLEIVDAELRPSGTEVVLTTSPQVRSTYTVYVAKAASQATGNLIDPTRSTATFFGGAETFPRVVGASSTGNTTVVVAYNKSMNDSAADPTSYTIVQENVHPEAGALTVLSAEFLGLDRMAVELTTLSQSEVAYTVTAVNVRDQLGNPLAPSSVFADHASADFAGTPPSGPIIDTDGDGLSDSEEQRGWVVLVVLAGGEPTMRDVTSDPLVTDTDGDGLSDGVEKRRMSDPRDQDTDDDLLDDYLEVTRLASSPTSQDTDGDGIDDYTEVDTYKTAAILADTDGDGFDDAREVFELNKDPRVADLPRLAVTVGDLALRIDERFVDQVTEAVITESSSTTTLSRSEQTQFSSSDTNSTQWFIEGGAELNLSKTWGLSPSFTLGGKVSVRGGYSEGSVSQTSAQSAQEAQEVYQRSLTKARQFAATVTREVVGASIDSTLVLDNRGDVAFTVSNLEVSALLPSRTRDSFVPVATLLPAGELISGDESQFNLGPFESKGPIVISNREIYPNLVEDLMRNPRGLIFEVANFDITDEFGRNIAFNQAEVLGRTVALTIDSGDGTFERFYVATSGAFSGACAAGSTNAGALCTQDADCLDGPCEETFFGGFDADGEAIALPMDFVLQHILDLKKNTGEPDAVVAGVNGRVDTVAVGDDIQVIPIGTTGLNDRSIVLLAGDNGVLDTFEAGAVNNANTLDGDDIPTATTGYQTSATCNADTSATIKEPGFDGDGFASTSACAGSPLPACPADATSTEDCCDDVQARPVGLAVEPGQLIVSAGSNGILETVVQGDDEFQGPGEPCDHDDDCSDGACDGREVLVRFRNSQTGDPNRFWVVLTSEEVCNEVAEACSAGIPAGSDFGDIPLRPRESVTLAFGQDIDRDGLFAREEFIYGSSDQLKDTDADTLSDFAEIRVGWMVEVTGRFPEQVFPDPRFVDSDLDGLEDPEEQLCVTDPTKRDTDGDGLFDVIELGITTDFDGDGRISAFEQGYGRCCTGVEGMCASTPVVPCLSDEDCEAEGVYSRCSAYPDTSEICPPPLVPPTWPARLDPRNSDTDGDTVSDREEFDMELNPLDPTDAGEFRDSDQDGLTDVEEQAGWEVEITLCSNTCATAFNGICDVGCDAGTDCADCPPATVTRQVFPDSTNGDSDFDGLPDLLEALILSDPMDDDTDGDGLLDYDEFDDFQAYENLNHEHAGFYLVEGDSQQLGTSLISQDGDNDRLSDSFELMEGWRVLVPGSGPVEVFSSPRYGDSDLDELSDLEEYLGADSIPEGRLPDDSGDATDPGNPDTDGDGRVDGVDTTYCLDGQRQGELCAADCDCCDPLTQACCNEIEGCCGNHCLGPNPLVQDMSVKVNLVRIDRLCGPEHGSLNDWRMSVKVRRPLQNEEDTILDALHLQQLVAADEDGMPPDYTQWGLCPLVNCEPVCSSFNPPVMFPPGHPQREFCTLETENINCGDGGFAPLEFDGVDTTFSLPLGDPFVVEIQFQEADGCLPDGTVLSSCDLFLEESYDSSALVGTPFMYETKTITSGSETPPECELTIAYEIQVASFAWEPDTFETSCSNLTDDDQDGFIDCADTDCDFAGFCEHESGGFTLENGWIYDAQSNISYGLTANGTWSQAEGEAVALGAHLVAVGSATENQFLLDWLVSLWPFTPSTAWIGYSDAAAEGNWLWSNGEPTVYTNWDSDEPNNSGNEDFALMVVNVSGWVPGQWNDVRYYITTYGIIEKYRQCLDFGTCDSGVCSNDPTLVCVTDADCPIDNDGDGLANCLDMGCSFADNCETGDWDVGGLPICDNGLDDDGDGFVDCDDFGCSNSAVCLCGNGIIDAGEQCDDGNGNDEDACPGTCMHATCGDGFTWLGEEECDDGNDDNEDACLTDCVAATCGDGFTWLGEEECDDGNDVNEDACLNDCVAATCGDGYVWQGQEECDDGDTIPGDGCDENCQIE